MEKPVLRLEELEAMLRNKDTFTMIMMILSFKVGYSREIVSAFYLNSYFFPSDEDEDVPLKNKKQDPTPKNSNKKAKKPTPAKAAPPPPPPKPEIEVDDDDDDDDTEEVFPTIGPYQCEICQVITDTKLEFVEHIKAKHKGIVDEEVLRSLESDIRKSKKKARKAEQNGKIGRHFFFKKKGDV